jgi:hypothetical protein
VTLLPHTRPHPAKAGCSGLPSPRCAQHKGSADIDHLAALQSAGFLVSNVAKRIATDGTPARMRSKVRTTTPVKCCKCRGNRYRQISKITALRISRKFGCRFLLGRERRDMRARTRARFGTVLMSTSFIVISLPAAPKPLIEAPTHPRLRYPTHRQALSEGRSFPSDRPLP